MYWHGAQCQVLPILYCRDASAGKAGLHSAAWLKRLMVCDISCSAFTVMEGVICFGALRTFSWLCVPLITFVLGRCEKRRRRYRTYALWHGFWHILSAVAIWGIVFNPTFKS